MTATESLCTLVCCVCMCKREHVCDVVYLEVRMNEEMGGSWISTLGIDLICPSASTIHSMHAKLI